jgi:hypothetical protein
MTGTRDLDQGGVRERDADRLALAAVDAVIAERAAVGAVRADWERGAHDVVAQLRGEAGRNPYDRTLSDLVGLLSMRSDEFRVRWASHDVLVHRSGTGRFRHSLVGDLTLAYERLDLPADPGLVIVTYSAEPGSASEAALRELERWSGTRARLSPIEAEA